MTSARTRRSLPATLARIGAAVLAVHEGVSHQGRSFCLHMGAAAAPPTLPGFFLNNPCLLSQSVLPSPCLQYGMVVQTILFASGGPNTPAFFQDRPCLTSVHNFRSLHNFFCCHTFSSYAPCFMFHHFPSAFKSFHDVPHFSIIFMMFHHFLHISCFFIMSIIFHNIFVMCHHLS